MRKGPVVSDTPASARLCDSCHEPLGTGGQAGGQQTLCSKCWSREPALPSVLRDMAVRELDVQGQAHELDAAALGWMGGAAK